MTPVLASDGARLALHRRGQGLPVMFQHGLCGDHRQTFEAFPDLPGWALGTLECRGHGASEAAGRFSIARFAGDLADVAPAGAVLGGISMGAAIALRLAVRHPGRWRALVLVRPAWGVEAAPPNMAPNAVVGQLLADGAGRDDWLATAKAARLAVESPDNLASLTGFFDRAPRDVTAALLCAISADGPGVSRADLAALRLPVLVAGCGQDAVHPLALARDLAAAIPGAQMVELPPKGTDKPAHIAALHGAITDFLKGLTP
jgi:pimeloyl-ACP methyl ester carboxylesterase